MTQDTHHVQEGYETPLMGHTAYVTLRNTDTPSWHSTSGWLYTLLPPTPPLAPHPTTLMAEKLISERRVHRSQTWTSMSMLTNITAVIKMWGVDRRGFVKLFVSSAK